jgi:CheY-like chemotaxis protein
MNRPATNESATPPLIIGIADDVLEIRMIARELLQKAGHDVVCATDGAELKRVAESRRLDLVLTDILMPEADGFEVISALKKANPNLRIIAMSGGGRTMTTNDCLRVARRLGADAILAKPFTGTQLLETVDAVWRRARGSV